MFTLYRGKNKTNYIYPQNTPQTYTLAQAHAVISREAQRGDRVTPLQDSCQQVPRSPPDKAGARSGHTGVGVRDWVPGPPALTVGNPRCEGGVPVADQSPWPQPSHPGDPHGSCWGWLYRTVAPPTAAASVCLRPLHAGLAPGTEPCARSSAAQTLPDIVDPLTAGCLPRGPCGAMGWHSRWEAGLARHRPRITPPPSGFSKF